MKPDRKDLATTESTEIVNARLSRRLAVIVDKVAQRIDETIEADGFKSGELAYLFQTLTSERSKLDGRTMTHGGSVNVQINNYGTAARTKEEILASIQGTVIDVDATVSQDVI